MLYKKEENFQKKSDNTILRIEQYSLIQQLYINFGTTERGIDH